MVKTVGHGERARPLWSHWNHWWSHCYFQGSRIPCKPWNWNLWCSVWSCRCESFPKQCARGTFVISLFAVNLATFASFSQTSLCESDDGVCKNDDEWFFNFYSQYAEGMFWNFFFLLFFPFLISRSLLRFHSSLLQPFQDSAVAKKFISLSKLLSTRNQFQEMVLNFTYRILKKRPDLASYCHHRSNRMFHLGIGVALHTFFCLALPSSNLKRAVMYFDFSVFRYRRLSFDLFPIFFRSLSMSF